MKRLRNLGSGKSEIGDTEIQYFLLSQDIRSWDMKIWRGFSGLRQRILQVESIEPYLMRVCLPLAAAFNGVFVGGQELVLGRVVERVLPRHATLQLLLDVVADNPAGSK